MLRLTLIVITGVAFLCGLIGLATGHRAALPSAIWGGIVFAALLFERWRYRASPPAPEAHWIRTDEAFVDPETGRTMNVWYDPQTGERCYIERSNDAGHP
jgi:hypothetical protein